MMQLTFLLHVQVVEILNIQYNSNITYGNITDVSLDLARWNREHLK